MYYFLSSGLFFCTAQEQDVKMNTPIIKVNKTDKEWKKLLTPIQYYVARQKGTERAFSGEYNNNKKSGLYECSNCKNPLFHSDTKFNSGTGWPSYYQPLADTSVLELEDISFGMTRTEIICAKCDAHLGHVFKDGPKPTGLRYCINSVSLIFQKENK